MTAMVQHYEETINQVMGDDTMALFGVPIAHVDPTVRACHVALAVPDSIRRRTHGPRNGFAWALKLP